MRSIKVKLSALFWDFTQCRLVVSFPVDPIFKRKTFFLDRLGTDRLSRNVGNKLPIYAAQNPKRVQISFTTRRMSEIHANLTILDLT